MERKLEGRNFSELKKSGLIKDESGAGSSEIARKETERLHNLADMRDAGEQAGMRDRARPSKKTPRERGSDDNAARLQELARINRASGAEYTGDSRVSINEGASSEKDRDLAQRERARALVEGRESKAEQAQRFAQEAWNMYRNGEISREDYESQNISPELTAQFKQAERQRFALTAREMLQEGTIPQEGYDLMVEAGTIDTDFLEQRDAEAGYAKFRAQDILQRGKDRIAAVRQESGRDKRVMTAEERRQVLEDLMAERDARLAADKQSQTKKKVG